ncbi:hypothetical protein EV177_003224 [Coemansia sp. RSA 1804]|nr:hypothetical protein EV177_003224 [Coemansia sp. RSA 1804]
MRRLRRVISKQSTSPQHSPVASDANATTWSGGDRDRDRTDDQARPATPDAATTATATNGGSPGDHTKESSPSFLGIDRWPIIGRSSQRRRETDALAQSQTQTQSMIPSSTTHSDPAVPRKSTHTRASQSFSMPFSSDATAAAGAANTAATAPAVSRDWRLLRDSSPKHKRTASSVLPSKLPQKLSFTGGLFSSATSGGKGAAAGGTGTLAPIASLQGSPTLLARPRRSLTETNYTFSSGGSSMEHASAGFIGYPPGGMEVESDEDGLVLLCEQKSPDVCEYTVRRDAVGVRLSDILAIALVSWAAHIFFGGPALLALGPMALYLAWSGTRVCQESLVVIRNVGIQTETITLAGTRSVRSFELPQIEDLFVHEALLFFEYRYYMAILPRNRSRKLDVVIMFPQLLPKLDMLLHVYHGARQLLFPGVNAV